MSKRIQELLQQREAIIKQQETILINARTEKRNPTVDEFESLSKMDADIADIEKTVEAEKSVQARINSLDDTHRPLDLNAELGGRTQQTEGAFESFGEMLVAVARAGSPQGRFPGAGQIDSRLMQMGQVMGAASGHSANVPADGGFLISPTRASEIMQRTYDGGEILSRCSTFEVGPLSDSFEVPYLDETSRATGSRWGGIRVYREGETDAPTSTKTKIGLWECRLSDLKAITYITERMMNDAPALESLIMSVLPEEFQFKLEDEILRGGGGASCQGIVGDPATVSIAKETGQAADTVLYENIIKMWARAWGRGRGSSAWYVNQDTEPQLMSMFMAIGTGGVPVWLPPTGLSASPYATLLGRPVIPKEQCATVGDVGDIIFANFNEYALIRKGGLNSASSIHVRFIYDEMTFKFNMRVNGKPKWKSALTPYKGSNSQSPFVTLAAR